MQNCSSLLIFLFLNVERGPRSKMRRWTVPSAVGRMVEMEISEGHGLQGPGRRLRLLQWSWNASVSGPPRIPGRPVTSTVSPTGQPGRGGHRSAPGFQVDPGLASANGRNYGLDGEHLLFGQLATRPRTAARSRNRAKQRLSDTQGSMYICCNSQLLKT